MAKREERFNSYETYSDIITTIVGSLERDGPGYCRKRIAPHEPGTSGQAASSSACPTGSYRGRTTVALSRDGQLFASSGFDPWTNQRLIELTRLWPEDLIESTCAHLSRNFTAAEWEEYFHGAPYHRTCPGIEGEAEEKVIIEVRTRRAAR